MLIWYRAWEIKQGEERMRRKLGIDTGKYATKCVMKRSREYNETDKELKFLSRMDNKDTDFGLLNGNTYMVEYNGKKYRIGENATYDSFIESKAEEIHKVCLYTAVALTVDNDDSVVIGIGCPLSIFINKEERNKYRQYMMGDKDITITIGGKKHHFCIENILVLPESSGVVYLHLEKYKDKTVGVIDLGGLNTNCGVYKNITPVLTTLFTTRLGGKVMRKQLLDLLNERLGMEVPLQDFQMDEVLKNGYVRNRKDSLKEQASRKLIHDYKYQHIKDIYDECIKHNWPLDTMDLIFIGGTSLFLINEIKEVFGVDDDSFFEDADMLNAKGFLRALG